MGYSALERRLESPLECRLEMAVRGPVARRFPYYNGS